LTPLSFDETEAVLRVGAPNRFKLDWARTNFSSRIEALAAEWFQRPVQVRFELDPGARAAPRQVRPAAPTAAAAGPTDVAGAWGPATTPQPAAAPPRAAVPPAPSAANNTDATVVY